MKKSILPLVDMSKTAERIVKSVDPDQMTHLVVYTVCSGLSVPIWRVHMLD